jgi:NAD+ synthase (glutamine-hydrolysing)
MTYHGFLRVGAATPVLRVADCDFNGARILDLLRDAERQHVAVVCFPELCLTGYTCADLFQQTTLQREAVAALDALVRAAADVFPGVAVVGLPLVVDDQLFNCAAVFQGGRVLGVVPKSFIPNYKEFYEGRWFTPAATARSREVVLNGQTVPFGTGQLFAAGDVDGLVLGVEICEDLWVPVPPSSFQALAGATVLLNPSASNEVIGKAAYRRQLVLNQSGRCLAAYVYAACGVWESTTDVVFGGHCLIAENGNLLARPGPAVRPGAVHAGPGGGGAAAGPGGGRSPVRAARRGAAARALRGDLSDSGGRPGQAPGAHRQAAGGHRHLRRSRLDPGPAGDVQDP